MDYKIIMSKSKDFLSDKLHKDRKIFNIGQLFLLQALKCIRSNRKIKYKIYTVTVPGMTKRINLLFKENIKIYLKCTSPVQKVTRVVSLKNLINEIVIIP